MNKEVILNLKANYKQLEQSVVAQMHMTNSNHQLTTGHYREAVWQSLFRQIIPKKFAIQQGVFLIDSNGNVSNEVDLTVFDEQYTPYIFNYGKIYYIPIEAVAMVVQCKSMSLKEDDLKKWVESIDNLATCKQSIARFAAGLQTESPKSQQATRPLKVLCTLTNCIDESGKPKFDFDIGMYAVEGKSDNNRDGGSKDENPKLKIGFRDELTDVDTAYRYLNGIDDSEKIASNQTMQSLQVGNGEHSILTLIFQLNQLLMLINNPMLFPHQAYAKMFDSANK